MKVWAKRQVVLVVGMLVSLSSVGTLAIAQVSIPSPPDGSLPAPAYWESGCKAFGGDIRKTRGCYLCCSTQCPSNADTIASMDQCDGSLVD